MNSIKGLLMFFLIKCMYNIETPNMNKAIANNRYLFIMIILFLIFVYVVK